MAFYGFLSRDVIAKQGDQGASNSLEGSQHAVLVYVIAVLFAWPACLLSQEKQLACVQYE